MALVGVVNMSDIAGVDGIANGGVGGRIHEKNLVVGDGDTHVGSAGGCKSLTNSPIVRDLLVPGSTTSMLRMERRRQRSTEVGQRFGNLDLEEIKSL